MDLDVSLAAQKAARGDGQHATDDTAYKSSINSSFEGRRTPVNASSSLACPEKHPYKECGLCVSGEQVCLTC